MSQPDTQRVLTTAWFLRGLKRRLFGTSGRQFPVRRPPLAAVVLLSFVLAVACSDDGKSPHDAVIIDQDEVPEEAGLGAGLAVADGSAPLAPSFPLIEPGRSEPYGFTSLLLVTGNPVDVLEQYLRQAAHLGLPLVASDTDLCRVTAPEGGPDHVMCHAASPIDLGDRDPPDTRRLFISLYWGAPSDERYPASHLTITYVEGDEPARGTVPHIEISFPSIKVPKPTPLARVGQTVGTKMSRSGFKVLDGSKLVASPLVTDSGEDAILRVHGDPGSVWESYLDTVGQCSASDEVSVDGERVRYALCGGGGASSDLRMITTREGTWLWLNWVDDP